jgi:hypothetical protein
MILACVTIYPRRQLFATRLRLIQYRKLRSVVAELPEWKMYVLGTAVWIGGHLALTAKHVLDAAIRKFGATRTSRGLEVAGHSIRLIQVLPGPVYRIWNVSRAWISSSDIAILHVVLDRLRSGGRNRMESSDSPRDASALRSQSLGIWLSRVESRGLGRSRRQSPRRPQRYWDDLNWGGWTNLSRAARHFDAYISML